jgi:predicted nucleotidyltransferase
MDSPVPKPLRRVDELRRRLRAELPRLKEAYGVTSFALFGSSVRGEAGAESDVDILVEFETPPTLFRFIDLECELSNLLQARVDLVMKDALKPALSRRILAEAVAV